MKHLEPFNRHVIHFDSSKKKKRKRRGGRRKGFNTLRRLTNELDIVFTAIYCI